MTLPWSTDQVSNTGMQTHYPTGHVLLMLAATAKRGRRRRGSGSARMQDVQWWGTSNVS